MSNESTPDQKPETSPPRRLVERGIQPAIYVKPPTPPKESGGIGNDGKKG